MSERARAFARWAVGLSAVWVALNLPHDLGSLKRVFGEWAGFPWPFAHWQHGRLEWLDPAALAGDAAVGLVAVTGVAGLCAWSRRPART